MALETVTGALALAKDHGLGWLDAQLLLSRCLGVSRSWVLAHDEAEVDGAIQAQFSSLVLRRSGGEPLAYLLGEKEFHGLVLKVDPRVLIPRPETEHLVDWGLEVMAHWRINEATPRSSRHTRRHKLRRSTQVRPPSTSPAQMRKGSGWR
jgi:release factor glutamine methyltransferase